MSDDPAGASGVMRHDRSLRAVAQYRRNIDALDAKLTGEDAALDQLGGLLTRARELAMQAASANTGVEARRAVGAEVRQLVRQAISLGNTRHGDAYLFGGAAGDRAPFDAAQTAAGPYRFAVLAGGVPIAQGVLAAEIGDGQRLEGQHDGKRVFLDSGALAALDRLATALETTPGDADAIAAAGQDVAAAFDDVQRLVGDVGARTNRLEATRAVLDALDFSVTEQRATLAEVDAEQAITEMLSKQTAYQSAMLATSRVLGLSLTDYLR
jgi:flagellar hook-associated protein 3 FlgL